MMVEDSVRFANLMIRKQIYLIRTVILKNENY